MEDVYQFAGESDMIVYLSDETMRAVEWLGDEAIADILRERGLCEGVLLSEGQIGTNASALAIRDGMPSQVVGPEHFYRAYHLFTDTAAPVYATGGHVMGVLGIVTPEEDSHPHTLGIVMAAAKAIENQLQADESLAEAHRHLAELNASLHAMSKGIVFLNPRGQVTHINASAGEILGVSHRAAMGRPLTSFVELPLEVREAMDNRAPITEHETVFQINDQAQPCLMSLDVLTQGAELLGFILTLELIAEARRLVHRMVGAKAHFTFDDILGESVKMQRVLYYARTIAKCNSPVLLLGESGTGKEPFAQAIHNESRYAEGPFITLDCAAIPRELMSGELFGYAESHRRSGVEGRPGKLELADSGTIFFDNVDSLPLNIQASLLRVLNAGEIVRLGGTRVIPLDVRIITASNNRDLADEVKQGHFRADLFYRLHAMTLSIPPLRERGNDILLLIDRLVEKFSQQANQTITVSPQAMAILQSYHWPGNVRELENVLEWALHMVDGTELRVEHLPQELRRATLGGDDEEMVLTLQEAERQAIIRAGQVLQGNQTRMAQALGIGRTTLWRKMKAYNLSSESFTRDNGGSGRRSE
jgi:transcriptional activator for dhaKLM operon